MAKIGTPIAFMIAAVAVTVFALPTLISADTEYIFLTIVVMLVAIIAMFILAINKN